VQVGLDGGGARRSGAFGVLGSWVAQVDFDGGGARRWSVPPSLNSRSYPFYLFLPAGGRDGGGGGGRGRRRAVALLLLMVAGGAGGGVWCWWRRC
jgi:hypothetical protein